MYFQPLVWTPDAPAYGINKDTAMARNPQSKIYNSIAYPNWKAANNKYDINPTFTDGRIYEKSKILAQWALPAIKNDYFSKFYTGGTAFTSLNWYWDPDGNVGQNETWPLFDGTYTNPAALTGALDGLPIGDLNWYPAKKTIWQNNKAAIDAHILALNTDQMNLTALKNINADKVKLVDTYPNPIIDIVTFDIKGSFKNNTQISIYNALGQAVEKLNIVSGVSKYVWNMTKLKSGIYYYDVAINGVKENGVLLKK